MSRRAAGSPFSASFVHLLPRWRGPSAHKVHRAPTAANTRPAIAGQALNAYKRRAQHQALRPDKRRDTGAASGHSRFH